MSTPKQQPSSSSSKLSLLTSSKAAKPFMKSKSQTTSSIVFPSFRFSPESEEIQEVVTTSSSCSNLAAEESSSGGGDAGGDPPPDPQPSSSTTTKSGGDISPLKEYILKHKWANKWDKRSLSLDLDLKGKIITAIEDKRRSFVSHFYNEEEEEEEIEATVQGGTTIITTSHSIPEQLVATTSGSCLERDLDTSSVHSDTTTSQPSSIRFFNFQEENNTDYYDELENYSSVSLPATPAEHKPHHTITTITDPALNEHRLRDLLIEEVGVDCCSSEIMDNDELMMMMDKSSSLLKLFVLPPEALQEQFMGVPTLYNPPSVIGNLRKLPIQEAASDENGVAPPEQVPSEDSLYAPESDDSIHDMRISSVLRKTVNDVVRHPWAVYWVGLLAALIVVDLPAFLSRLGWFVLGALGSAVVARPFWESSSSRSSCESMVPRSGEDSERLRVVSGEAEKRVGIANAGEYAKAQGWMLTYPLDSPMYSAFTYHLRATKVIFVRLNGSYLTLSHPHSRHRIPKRRLWNDPQISIEHMFVRHSQYNMHGAKVEILPIGLTRKRVWCKKYPIAITLACKEGTVGVRHGSPAGEEEDRAGDNNKKTQQQQQHGNDPMSVNFSSKEGVSVNVGERNVGGDVFREECEGKVIYLFARTDREKDDWFRRLVHATKTRVTNSPSYPRPRTPDLSTFVTYMQRACPTLNLRFDLNTTPESPLTSRRSTPTNELWESVSIGSLEKQQQAQQKTTTSSPQSSRKTTPEKEEMPSALPGSSNPGFLNALIGRLFFDFLRSPKWTHEVRTMIDRKLYFIRKPPFVESLMVKDLDLGQCLPVVNLVSAPLLDKQGLWIDMDVSYTGNMVITIETFVNFMNLRKEQGKAAKKVVGGTNNKSPSREHAMFDSDADDSGESSESEDEGAQEELLEETSKNLEKNLTSDSSVNKGKLMKYAESISKSSVMRNKHVQKVVGNIASTPLVLTVEIKRIDGVLAINVPPLPNDRVWIGFRGNPVVEINARPKVGERALTLSHLTEWIKRKLLLEFQRVMVCPNMMDVTVPLMEFDLPK